MTQCPRCNSENIVLLGYYVFAILNVECPYWYCKHCETYFDRFVWIDERVFY